MVTVKVNLPKVIADRLSILAKERDFSTREEFLRLILTQVAQDEFQLESDKRYDELIQTILNQIQQHEQVIETNSQILEKFYELGGRRIE
ncbi:hypothetical protein [Turicibacter bilis]|uniref:hypothetical protein n=1 Tax=Turicibacter bilis TaxID=2735723 RepID=UPI001BB03A7A|nr:hypothetical protein [Turicibacter bilis]MBS3198971.1 hypothetical protein [Turicibacter bilis]